jgi:hypothetical protein
MAFLSFDSRLPTKPLAWSVMHVCTIKGRTYTIDTPLLDSKGICAGKPKPQLVCSTVLRNGRHGRSLRSMNFWNGAGLWREDVEERERQRSCELRARHIYLQSPPQTAADSSPEKYVLTQSRVKALYVSY